MVLTIILVDSRLGSLMKKSQQVSVSRDGSEEESIQIQSFTLLYIPINIIILLLKKTFLGRTNVKRKELGVFIISLIFFLHFLRLLGFVFTHIKLFLFF